MVDYGYILYATQLWNDAKIMEWSIFEGEKVPWIKWPMYSNNYTENHLQKNSLDIITWRKGYLSIMPNFLAH